MKISFTKIATKWGSLILIINNSKIECSVKQIKAWLFKESPENILKFHLKKK